VGTLQTSFTKRVIERMQGMARKVAIVHTYGRMILD
jgi:hypothetical protein